MPHTACLGRHFLKLLGLTLVIPPLSWVQAATQCSTATEIPITECEALVNFYNQTNGTTWQKNTGWNKNDTPCQWWGITCENGYVTKLYLENNNLTGPLPDSLGQLNHLQELSLSGNQLSGFIPDSFEHLIRLQVLHLSSNLLNGSIPNSLGNLRNLQGLYLNNNQLQGSVPESLGNLDQLQNLSLNNNQLNATLPDSLGNLTRLQGLDLSHNQITGSLPRSLVNLKKLVWLKLDYNQLNSSLPDWLEKLNDLQWLVLNNNQLSGSIPNSLGKLTRLQVLYLDSNQLTGSIPESLGNLTNLQQLVLKNNQLNGIIPETLGNLNDLQDLYLGNNELCGDIPPTLTSLAAISYLSLNNNHLTTSDSNLLNWINKLNPDWLHTQTPCGQQLPEQLDNDNDQGNNVTETNSQADDNNNTCLIYALQDEGLNNSQFFTVDPQNNFTVTPLGNSHPEYDIEDIDILSTTTEIYASSGDNPQANHEKGYLYQVNKDNGELIPVCSTGLGKVSAISFYPHSQNLWLWAGSKGLFVIDLKEINQGVCYPKEIFHYSAQVEGITWDVEGKTLYGATGNTLYKYIHDTGTVEKACDGFPSGVEALEMLADGSLLFALHSAKDTSIHSFDVNTCSVIDKANFPIETHYDDIEGIAWTCRSQ